MSDIIPIEYRTRHRLQNEFGAVVHNLLLNLDICIYFVETNRFVSELQRAVDWLTLQRGKNWGWGTGTDTAQAIVAMEMTKTGDLLERELSAKQLEIELLARLWQHHDPESVTLQQQDDEDEALTVANIATYSMALASACHDPRQFHGHDLIGKKRLDRPNIFTKQNKCILYRVYRTV